MMILMGGTEIVIMVGKINVRLVALADRPWGDICPTHRVQNLFVQRETEASVGDIFELYLLCLVSLSVLLHSERIPGSREAFD